MSDAGVPPGAAGPEDEHTPNVEIGAQDAGPSPVGVQDPTFFTHFPQFVLFPLIVVIIAVLIVVFFKATVEDSRSASDILGELRTSWRKGQTAFDLAVLARTLEDEGKRFSQAETRQLITILRETETSDLRTFLIEALGRAGDETLALEELLQTIEGATEVDRERVNVIAGLGLSRSERAVQPLIGEFDKAAADDAWEVRLNVLAALANIAPHLDSQSPAVADIRARFRSALGDSNWTVSWNAALLLAHELDDDAGLDVLRQILDPEYLKGHVSAPRDRELWLEKAIDAIASLDDAGSFDLIKPLENDSSAKVRNAVFKYLKRVEALRPATARP